MDGPTFNFVLYILSKTMRSAEPTDEYPVSLIFTLLYLISLAAIQNVPNAPRIVRIYNSCRLLECVRIKIDAEWLIGNQEQVECRSQDVLM